MALSFDETHTECPGFAKECLSLIVVEDHGKAMTAARTNFEQCCKKKDMKGKFHALLVIAKIHLATGELYDAKEVAEKALQVLGRGSDAKQEAAVLHTMAKINLKLCKYGLALQVAEEAAGLASKANSKAAEAAILKTMAEIHLGTQKKQEALKVAKQALGLFKDANEKHGEADCLSTVVNIHVSLKRYDDALRSANEIVGIYEGSDSVVKSGAAMLVVSEVRKAMSEPGEAEEVASKAVELFENASEKRLQAMALRKLAETCFANNNPTDGWTFVKEARELSKSVSDEKAEASIIGQIAAAHINAGNFEEGGMIGEEGINLCRTNGFQDELANLLWTMADGNIAWIQTGAHPHMHNHVNWQARTKAKEALAIYQMLGNLPGQAKCLNVLAMASIQGGFIAEGKARAKAAVQVCKEIEDKDGEGMNLLLVAQTRLYDNKDEALRLARLAEKLLKEGGNLELIKGAEQVVEYCRDFDGKGGKKTKEELKAKLSEVQSEKTDITMDLDFGKSRGAYFHGFTARATRAR